MAVDVSYYYFIPGVCGNVRDIMVTPVLPQHIADVIRAADRVDDEENQCYCSRRLDRGLCAFCDLERTMREYHRVERGG